MSSVDLIASFAFTWVVGLAPPLLARYVIARRPFEHAQALMWSFIFGLSELLLFVALGSTSKTHAVLLLIGIVAYRILRASPSRFDRRPPVPTAQENVSPRNALGSPSARLSATPAGRLTLLAAAAWAVISTVYVGLGAYDLYAARDSVDAAQVWREQYEKELSEYCPNKAYYECREASLSLEMLTLSNGAARRYRESAESSFVIAVILAFGLPLLVSIVSWVALGRLWPWHPNPKDT